MSVALENAGISPGEVDAVFADAFGVPEIDALEAQAIRSVFGEHAGERARDRPEERCRASVRRRRRAGRRRRRCCAMRDGALPPIVNLEEPAEGCGLDFVTGSERSAQPETILVNARGFGGFNSALVLRRMS